MKDDKKKKHEDSADEVQEELVEETEPHECEEKVQKLEETVLHLDNQLKRAVADYINLQKRVEEEKREVIKYANQELLLSLLPALNTLFLAAKYTEDQGVQLTIKSVLEVLKNVGVEKIPAEGVAFNAVTMEAVEVVAGDDGKVVEEVRPGFTIYGKLLSPSLVKVGGKGE